MKNVFECKRCGFCCHGQTTVSLDKEDQERMIDTLGLTRYEVEEKFWRISRNCVQMKIVDNHCIFYKDGCTVHPGRPSRCRQWPFHEAILKDRENFEIIKESCPGINQKASYETFCKIVKKYNNKKEL